MAEGGLDLNSTLRSATVPLSVDGWLANDRDQALETGRPRVPSLPLALSSSHPRPVQPQPPRQLSASRSTLCIEDEDRPGVGFRRRVWQFLTSDPQTPVLLYKASLLYQVFTAVVVVMLFATDRIDKTTREAVHYWWLEAFAVVMFALDYGLRLYSCIEDTSIIIDGPSSWVLYRAGQRCRTAFSLEMVLDALALLSLALTLSTLADSFRSIVSLKLLRLLALIRVERQFHIFAPVMGVLREKKFELIGTLGVASALMLVSASVMFYIESPTNPSFSSTLEAMWWATTALTTVGYGDIYPKSGAGKFFGSLVAFTGVGLFALPAAIVTSGFQEYFEREKEAKRQLKALKRRQARADILAAANLPRDASRGSSGSIADCPPTSSFAMQGKRMKLVPAGKPQQQQPQQQQQPGQQQQQAPSKGLEKRLAEIEAELAFLKSGQQHIIELLHQRLPPLSPRHQNRLPPLPRGWGKSGHP